MASYLEQARAETIDLAAVIDLQMEPQEKRVFLAALDAFGIKSNEQTKELIRLFNFDVSFPYYFIRDHVAH
jgi:hypothetical protein